MEESEYFIYDRGPIAQELHELREQSVGQTREINRLTRENTRLMEDLRRAEAIVGGVARRHPRHQIGHPPPDRATINQTLVNNLFNRARMNGGGNVQRQQDQEDEGQ